MLLAFLLRSLIPVGFMPTAKADNGIALSLCYSGAPHVIALGMDEAPAQSTGDTCPFGLFKHPLPGVPTPPAILPAPAAFTSIVLARHTQLLLSAANGPPVGSRAPPV